MHRQIRYAAPRVDQLALGARSDILVGTSARSPETSSPALV